MADDFAVHVRGLRDLERAFGAADRAVQRDLKDALEEAAAPVRSAAQLLAVRELRNIRDPWVRTRVGSARSVAYVVPVERGTRQRQLQRPEFKDFLLDRAYVPALQANRDRVARQVRTAIGRGCRRVGARLDG
jgi:hypothetical protein